MPNNFKPAGYNSASPYFIVKDGEEFIAFLKEVFHGTSLRTFNRPDGGIMHAEVQIDDSVMMISETTDHYPANLHMMHMYVPDVDATYRKAIALGCQSLEAPVQKEGDPDKRGGFQDHAGNTWYISTQLAG